MMLKNYQEVYGLYYCVSRYGRAPVFPPLTPAKKPDQEVLKSNILLATIGFNQFD